MNGAGVSGANLPIYTNSVIVPHPGDGQLYYIFKTNLEHGGIPFTGLHYAIVDMSRDNGLGAVVSKQFNIIPVTSPLISVVKHTDDKSYWVVVHGWIDNVFYALHVTESGISAPVISTIGGVYGYEHYDTPLQMKVSPDGTKLAVTQAGGLDNGTYRDGFAHLFDFNSMTGVVSNFRELDVWSTGGVEFSPNSELLYFTAYRHSPFASYPGVVQLDVSTGLVEDINASQIQLGFDLHLNEFGYLQLGPNGKIYGTDQPGGQSKEFYCVVNNPDVKGFDCNYSNNGVAAPADGARWRFPFYVQSIFRESPSVPDAKGCKNIEVTLKINSLGYADSIQWNFGDGTSKSFITATGKIVKHTYSNLGVYNVKVIKYIGNLSREFGSTITIIERPEVNLGRDTVLCRGDVLLLDAKNDGMIFTWSTGETAQTILVDEANTYQVSVDNGSCSTSDVIDVQVHEYPSIDLGADQIICDGTLATLSVPSDPDFTFEWSNGSQGPKIEVTESGTYWVKVSNGGCSSVNEIRVTFGQISLTLPVSDFEVQYGDELHVRATALNGKTWNWNFGDDNPTVTTDADHITHDYKRAGEYNGSIEVTNEFGCDASLPFHVKVPVHLKIPNIVTANDDMYNDIFEIEYNGEKQPLLVIYNREGKVIYKDLSFECKWNPQANDAGIYFYQINLAGESYKGWVQVVK